MNNSIKLLIIGGGKMGYAIAKGVVNSKIIAKQQFAVIEVNDVNRGKLIEDLDCIVYPNETEIDSARLAIFAVKPMIAKDVMQLYSHHKFDYVASVMAGVQINTIKKYLPNSSIVRLMPNTPTTLGVGATAYVMNEVNSQLQTLIEKIFSPLGAIEKLDDELQIDLITALIGSGPGFIYYFAQQFIDYAKQMGIEAEVAEKLIRGTFHGTGKMMTEFQTKSLSSLIADVSTPGGTTIAGLDSFSKSKLDRLIKDGLKSSFQRAVELGKS